MTLTPSHSAPVAPTVSLTTTAPITAENGPSNNPSDEPAAPRGVKRSRSEEQHSSQTSEAFADEGGKWRFPRDLAAFEPAILDEC